MRSSTSSVLLFVLLTQSLTHAIKGDYSKAAKSLKSEQVVRDESKTMPRQSAWQVMSTAAQGFWNNPISLGLVLGLLLIGPDHLGTLMALSTLTSGVASFKVGFAWGLGHSLGMILIIPIFWLMREWLSKGLNVSLDSWEHWGDYFIGISMVVLAIYFVVCESSYLEKQDDGTYKAKSCACHSSSEEHDGDPEQDSKPKFCASYGKVARRDNQTIPEESSPLLMGGRDRACATRLSERDYKGAILGVLQGLCCPMGLAGIGFLGRMSASSTPLGLFLFAISFALASGAGSGAITAIWGAVTTRGFGDCVSPRVMYMTSCLATFGLGALWIVANAFGFLHRINFEEHIHHKIQLLHDASLAEA